MNVLIVGSGAREHAVAWKLRQSSLLTNLFVASGNAGTAQIAENLPLTVPKTGSSAQEWEIYFDLLATIGRQKQIDLFVIPPEDSLANGVVDYLNKEGFAVFGPTQAAAQIEGSKIWSHQFMSRQGIPTPESWICASLDQAKRAIYNQPPPLVLKANGVAAGKGVEIAYDYPEAISYCRSLMVDGVLGKAGQEMLIQSFRIGREVSLASFTDGYDAIHLPLACDYKKLGEGNTGPNTGGIGAYSPAVWVKPDLIGLWQHKITAAAISGLEAEGRRFQGVLYPGLIVRDSGTEVLEFNCRLGDPETQVQLPKMQGDLLEVMLACTSDKRELLGVKVSWDQKVAVCVVLCSGGYPARYETGFPIYGLESVPDDVLVFHAGTKKDEKGQIVTNGGRVLSVVALKDSLEEARDRVYEAISHISFKDMYFRRDIALL